MPNEEERGRGSRRLALFLRASAFDYLLVLVVSTALDCSLGCLPVLMISSMPMMAPRTHSTMEAIRVTGS